MAQDKDDQIDSSYSLDEVQRIYEDFRDFLRDHVLPGRIANSVKSKVEEKIKELDEQIESMSTEEEEDEDD
jgi:hypothetical protein